MAQEPTILVKKADGTTERVPLSAVKKKNAAASMPANSSTNMASANTTQTAPINPKSKTPASSPTMLPKSPMPPNIQEIKTQPLVIKEKTMSPSLSQTSAPANDFSVPLEELQPSQVYPVASDARSETVDAVIKNVSFVPPSAYLSRLKSIIRLRLKDIRTEEETLETLQKPVDQGGLSFTLLQAQEIASQCAGMIQGNTVQPVPVSPALEEVKSVSASQTNFMTEEMVTPIVPTTPSLQKLSGKPAVDSAKNGSLMMDITSKPVKLTPIEEIAYFTLVDFRRLSPQIKEAIMRLEQKFTNLKDESYLLYLETLNVWQKSPLYLQYIQAIDESFAKRASISTVLSGEEKLSLEEFLAIAQMQGVLRP